MLFVRQGNKRAGGANRIVPEKNRNIGTETGKPMMIEYFDYLQFPCPLDCLREFIVIDEYQLARDWLDKMTLGKDANEPLINVQDRENVFGRIGDDVPHRL